uniref:Vomeronasal type-1 receptor n=1 Tax=Panagrolaimus davidi TaxID=227884 RepID=A0A914QRE4_9BILA
MGIFLCINRCLTITFPVTYGKLLRKTLGYFTAITLLTIYGLVLWQNKSFELIPEDRPTTCYYRGCLVGSRTATTYTQQKLAISVIDIIAGIILFVLIRCNFTGANISNKSKRLNATALLIVVSSTLFDFCPSLFYRFVPLNLEKPLSWYIGPYLITLGSFGVTLCAGIYAKAFKSVNKNRIVQHLS